MINYGNYGFRDRESSIIAKEINPNISWKVTTAPTVEPITKTELKEWARIDGNLEDDLITTTIKTTRQLIENYIGRALITQTVEMVMDYWPSTPLELPRPPLISITSVQTLDEDDVATSYSSDNYFTNTNSEPGRLIIKNSVTPPYNTTRFNSGYKITYACGYGSTAAYVPQQLKDACKVWATVIYENRSISPEPPPIVKNLLDPYKVYYL